MVVHIDIQIIQWRDIDSNKNIGRDSYCSCVVGITPTKYAAHISRDFVLLLSKYTSVYCYTYVIFAEILAIYMSE